jgi:hypothetical protein
MAPTRTSDHGTTCTKCESGLPAAEWVEATDDGKVHYLWWCNNCGNKFITVVDCPIDAAPKMSVKDWERMFPPLLVA